MAVLNSEEARRHRASKHAGRGEECECGRTVYGNGGKISHRRKCSAYLSKHGWPFSEAERSALFWRAMESVSHLPPCEQHAARRELMHNACMDEARRRGLIAAS